MSPNRAEYNFVMGVASGMPVDADLLPAAALDRTGLALADHADRPRRNLATCTSARRNSAACCAAGLEDSFYLPDGSKAGGNGALIEALAACARRAGREVASAEEARRMLGLRSP
jgi:3-keto-5-aminohexanoate cleavage enzyme